VLESISSCWLRAVSGLASAVRGRVSGDAHEPLAGCLSACWQQQDGLCPESARDLRVECPAAGIRGPAFI
jgi:hypothetical protein